MQMRVLTTSILFSCLVVLACGTDVKRGNAGESCTAANDCGDGLACIALVCVASGTKSGAQEDGGKPNSDSSSCSARRDCPEGSMCVDNSCQTMAMGMSTDARLGGRGESCTAANDCEPELSCLTGMCRESGLALPHLAKACYRVECENKDDCCATFMPNANCEMYKANCDSDPIFCNTYRSLCVCSKTCEKELCIAETPGCKTDQECTSAQTPFCVEGTCHQCNQDSACPGTNSKCAQGVCMSPCADDANCPLLYACQDNACVRTGCQSDRECAFITSNPRAKCTDKMCKTPCATDSDCSSMDPTSNSFEACVEGQCKFVGCETDTECRAALGIAALPGKVRAVCR
ncbi:MAG TPA: hypothetical protein VFN67_11845 [Polyangiales bacterium]|nr:hypothetical protein [Polyangiales bacterium]